MQQVLSFSQEEARDSGAFEPVFRVAALTSTTIGAAMVVSILVLPELLELWGRPIGRSSTQPLD